MKNLAALAIRYRIIVVNVVTFLVSWGVISFYTMPRREDPEFTIRTCTVTTQWPGAPAVQVEELVTDPLEEALDGLEEVDVVRSTTTTGLSTIMVDLEDSVSSSEVDNVWDKVRARVEKVNMPVSSIRPQVNAEFGDTHIVFFTVYQTPVPGQKAIREQDRYSPRQLDVYSDQVKDALRLLPGVAKVDRFGVQDEVIYVETDAGNWSQLNLTVAQLRALVAERNIVASGGSIDSKEGRFAVKTGGELNAVEEIKTIVVGVTEDNPPNQIYLRDLGLKVHRDYQDPPSLIARYGDAKTSAPCVVVALTMKSGANILNVIRAAKARVKELQVTEKALPPDIAVTPVSDQSEGVENRIGDVIINVVEAILIVIVVVYLVVGFRTAMVMAANIPVVVLTSLAIVTLFDVQLEQISLASIIIALGLLVDNAVQVCDQSRTNQIQGMKPAGGTVAGAKMLAMPMLNGTLTTIAAFFPMLIALEGGGAEFIYSLPVTISVILGVSWVLAMTFCVILSATFIRAPKDSSKPSAPLPWVLSKLQPKNRSGSQSSLFSDWYGWLAKNTLRMKFLVIGLAFALLLGALMLPVGSEFFPQDERDQFVVEISLPEAATIEQTDAVAKQVEEMIRKLSPSTDENGKKVERLRSMRALVGGGGSRWYLSWSPEPRKPNYAEIFVRVTDGKYTSEMVRRVRELAERGDAKLKIQPIVGARVTAKELMLGPPADPIVIRVSGNGFADEDQLREIAGKVEAIVQKQPGAWNVHNSWGAKGFQLHVDVDADKANLAGVTNQQVAQTLNAYFSGELLTVFREGDHQIPVQFRLQPEERRSLAVLQTAFVEGEQGRVPLDSIATVERRWESALIERRDLNRTIEIRGQVEPGVSGNDVVNTVMSSQEMKDLQAQLPSGYRIEVGGALEESAEASEQFLISFGISLVIIVQLLVFQYNSISKTVIILVTLPLALGGAMLGLWLTGNPVGFMPQLGILALFGIVLNTAIIYVEFADLLIRERSRTGTGSGPISGLTREEYRACLIEAGKSRLLPIFLTTATTIGGLIPLALFGGPLWVGMAWCMIVGLSIATVLTLFVVPALCAVMAETFGIQPVAVSEAPQEEVPILESVKPDPESKSEGIRKDFDGSQDLYRR